MDNGDFLEQRVTRPLSRYATPFQGPRRFAPQLLPIRAQLPLVRGAAISEDN